MDEIKTTESLKENLRDLFDLYFLEEKSGVPNAILAEYVLGCLDSLAKFVEEKKEWLNENCEQTTEK